MSGIAFFTCCFILFAGMTEKTAITLSPELQTEAMKQYDRLEALRSGILPVSRFADFESVHRKESLILPSDRDPADIVIRRTRALWNDLVTKNPEVREMEGELIKLERAAKEISVTTGNERMELYLKACSVRRQIAFANPLLDFNRLVFVTHKRNPRSEAGGDHMAGQYYGIHATKGEGLFILEDVFSNKVKARNIMNGQLPDGAYLSPELSFDGSKILFAYTEAEGYRPEISAIEDTAGYYNYSGLQCSFTDKNAWHIYSVNTDGSNLRQLTSGVFNDFDPCWLPSGEIVFISDRRGGFGRCHMSANGGAPWFTYTLHRMDADGRNMERLSHHETCEWQPSILHDGNIVYTRWDYVDRGFFQAHHPWTTTPDGRNALSVHGNYPENWKDRPCMEMDIRAIPNSQNLIATAAAHHGQTYGSIVLVNPQLDDDDAMSQVKLVTPDERFPETEYGYYCREASYSTPWPLSEDYYLCVFGYPELTDIQPSGSDSKYSIENYGIYLLDAFGNAELLYRDPEIACLSPIPLKARPVPPVIPDIVQPYLVDFNQPRLNLDRSNLITKALQEKAKEEKNYDPAVVSIMNIYENRLDWPKDTKITDLRIIQVLPKSNPGRNNPAIGYGTEKNARVVLGTVPVEKDGSVCFYLQPYIPVFFQALDSEGRAVQSMRSDVYAAPKEQLSCIGCHENRKTAPTQRTMPLAMKRKPSVVKPEVEGSNPFSYVRLVQPVWNKNCMSCHAPDKTAPNLSGEIDNDLWLPSYRNLKPYAFYYDGGGSFTESKTYPGKFGAMESKLYQLLEKGHKNVKLTAEEKRRITLWLDCNSDFYGTYENLEAQKKGEIVHPILE
jgi:hypothetical protein